MYPQQCHPRGCVFRVANSAHIKSGTVVYLTSDSSNSNSNANADANADMPVYAVPLKGGTAAVVTQTSQDNSVLYSVLVFFMAEFLVPAVEAPVVFPAVLLVPRRRSSA